MRFHLRSLQSFALILLGIALWASWPAGALAQSADAAATGADVQYDYRLGAGDRLRLTVFNETELSGEFPISPTGTLSLPLIGEVRALGRTTEDVRAEIERRLADGYLRRPRVSLDIAAFRPFFILGEVNRPGQYPFLNGLTALSAIAVAEGYTYRADRRHVYIRREGETHETRVRLTPDIRIAPGDTVRIGERYF